MEDATHAAGFLDHQPSSAHDEQPEHIVGHLHFVPQLKASFWGEWQAGLHGAAAFAARRALSLAAYM